jgi:HPt (histidine-containing phosphotransfer) domain-containing protein
MVKGTAARKVVRIETARYADNNGPIDRVHLARQTLGDQSLAHEVLHMYGEMAATYFSRLETSTNRNDLMVNLHALKGASMGVGAFRLAELAKTAEDELKAGMPVNPERVHDVGIAVEEVRAFIADMLMDEPA